MKVLIKRIELRKGVVIEIIAGHDREIHMTKIRTDESILLRPSNELI